MQESKETKDKLGWLIVLLVIIIIVWICSIYILPKFYTELTDRGLFGDSFGLINSLFSGLAFAGIIYTILLQRKELALQREELKETRNELKRTADAQESSERQLKNQSDNLKISAKLTALGSLIDAFASEEKKYQKSQLEVSTQAKKRKEKYIIEIEKLLSNM